MNLTILLTIIIFLIGIYFYAIFSTSKEHEGFSTGSNRCPNMLIQKDSKFYLYNSNLAQVPGVNPIEFDNLEDYTEFLDWQRSQGIRCPVLYLQSGYDAQGNKVYKSRPSVSEPQAGLQPLSVNSLRPNNAMPTSIASSRGNLIVESDLGIPDRPAYPNPTLLVDATHNDPPYNHGNYPAHDQTSYYIGTTTPLDAMDIQQEKADISPNPMDSNWGGAKYTQSLIDKGYYKENEVKIAIN